MLREWGFFKAGDDGDGSSVSLWFYRNIKPPRRRVYRPYIFILWLSLCFDRRWIEKIKARRVTMNEMIEPPADLIKEFKLRPTAIAEAIDTLEEFTGDPNDSTLRKRLQKKETIASIFETIYSPIMKTLGETIAGPLARFLQSIKFPRRFRLAKFNDAIREEGTIGKRDLMRRLRLTKKQADMLLSWAERDGVVRIIKKTPSSPTLICYVGKGRP